HHHFASLADDDLRTRFGRRPDAEWLRLYVEGIDFARDSVLGVRDGTRLVGVTHVALFEGAAELGLSVVPSHRRRGIAAAMFERGVLHARNRGVVELFMHCLSENQAMRRIARNAGMRILVEGGDTDAWIELPPATPFTLGRELVAHQLTLVDLALRPWQALQPA
ncbi:MAG TPA: GNAT family N-acetyltransferase, partial [Burkholderiaceae bacterium]|nr:GNAT family N-acetyltransferase [Burkholderiaceae bacterium]